MKIKLSDYIANYLVKNNIKDCFTVVGGGAMHLNDSFGHHKNMHCLYFHHEQAASFAAESYARINNNPALLCLTTGPGGTNALTGVLCAYLDSLPMIIISGQVKKETSVHNIKIKMKLRSLGDQEYDICKVAKQMCKDAYYLDNPNDIKYILDKAIDLSMSGRKGPVWIDIPIDIQSSIIDTNKLKSYKANNKELSITSKQIDKIINLIKNSNRPVLYPGNGIRLADSYDLFKKVTKKLNIPVCTYWDSIDLIETNNPLYVGRAGNMADRAGNFAVQNADLLLVIGNRLSIRNVGYNYESWAPNAKVIMVDIDEAELNKPTIHVDYKIHMDAKDFLNKLNDKLDNNKLFNKKQWLDKCLYWKNKYPVVLDKHKKDKELNIYYAFDYISKNLKNNSITVSSNGSCCVVGHQTWFIKNKTRFINNNAVASMGYGLPASIGACIANNKKEIICLEGDGSIMMNIQELQTIVTNKLPIKIFLINNDGYHSIRQTQNNIFPTHNKVGIGKESNDLSFPEFKKIAKAFDIPYYSCKTNKNLKSVIDRVLNHKGYLICELFVSTTQLFEPKNQAKVLKDGTIVSSPLEDLYPFLDEEELKDNILR